MQGNQSEVARIRAQIEEECEALCLAMNGSAMGGRHEMISHKYKALDKSTEELAAIVGPEQAVKVACEVYNKAMEK